MVMWPLYVIAFEAAVAMALGVTAFLAIRRLNNSRQIVALQEDLIAEIRLAYTPDTGRNDQNDQTKSLAVLLSLHNLMGQRNRRNFTRMQLAVFKMCMEIRDTVIRSALLRRLSEVCFECGSQDIANLALSNIFDERVIANCGQVGEAAKLRQIRDDISQDPLISGINIDQFLNNKDQAGSGQVYAPLRPAVGY